MKTELNVELIQHTDVRGKEQRFVKVGDYLINIGEKTWEAIKTEIIKKQVHDNEKIGIVSRET